MRCATPVVGVLRGASAKLPTQQLLLAPRSKRWAASIESAASFSCYRQRRRCSAAPVAQPSTTAVAAVGKRPTLQLVPRSSESRGGDSRITLRQVPWVFRNEAANVEELRAYGHPALLVDVVSSEGVELGTAICNLQKGGPSGTVNILARMLSNNANDAIDVSFFASRIRVALQNRERTFGKAKPYYRLLNGEGDQLPGVICDRFDDVLCLQFSSAAMEHLFADEIADALETVLSPRAIVGRYDVIYDRSLELAPLEPPRVLRGTYEGPTSLSSESNYMFVADMLRQGWTVGRHFEERRLRQQLSEAVIAASCSASSSSSAGRPFQKERLAKPSRPRESLRVLSLFGEGLGIFCCVTASQAGNRAYLTYAFGNALGSAGVLQYEASSASGHTKGAAQEDKSASDQSQAAIWLLADRNGCSDRLDFIEVGEPGVHALAAELRGAYEVVLLEPPSLAPSYGRAEEGLRLYTAWAAAAAAATAPGGLLVVVSRSRGVTTLKLLRSVNLGIWSAGRSAKLVHKSFGGAYDFPVHLSLPDAQAFRVLAFRLD